MKKGLIFVTLLLVGATAANAQRNYDQAELDALLAPIALHPDPVISQALIAATYPEEVAQAAAWSRANPHARGEDAVRAVAGQAWDPAVKSLVAFPELLTRMADSPQWLRDLGEAFLGDQARVMDTVQGLRRRAQASGHLATTGQTAVYTQGDAIVVQPRTQIVYVSYYDPYVVYGPWWWPHYRPLLWRPWAPRPVFISYGFFYSAPDWHRRYVRVVHRPAYVRVHDAHVAPGRWQHRSAAPAPKPMPAANGFSHQNRDRETNAREPRREQRGHEPRENRGHRG